MSRDHVITTRLDDEELDILEAFEGTRNAEDREPMTHAEAFRLLLRQWARDYNYKSTNRGGDGKP